MTRYKFTAVDKLKEGEMVDHIGFIYVPKPFQWKRKPRPDVRGYVEAINEKEAIKIAKGQIKRLWSYCKLQDLKEV